MRYEELWAAFRSFIDAIDAGTMTTSDVRKEMIKLQKEEKNELDPNAGKPSDPELGGAPSNAP